MQQLERNYPPISAKQDPCKYHHHANLRSSRLATKKKKTGPGRECKDQIFTQRNIIEQCTEWQRHLYINFVDFEKAFAAFTERVFGASSEHTKCHKVLIIRSFHNNFACRVGSIEISFIDRSK